MADIVIRNATVEDSEPIARLATELGYPTSTSQMRQRLEAIVGDDDYATFDCFVERAPSGRSTLPGSPNTWTMVVATSIRDAFPGQDRARRQPRTRYGIRMSFSRRLPFLYGGEIIKPTAVTPMSTRAGNQIASATRPGGDCRRVSQ